MKTNFFRSAKTSVFACLLGLSVMNVQAGPSADKLDLQFDFSKGSHGWSFDFADYREGEEDKMGLTYQFAPLPAYLGNIGKNGVAKDKFAILLSGMNTSSDLFSFMRKQISGLKPLTRYYAFFKVTIASNAPSGMVGAGGPPGESVFLKVGAVPQKPQPFPYGNRLMNIDKGNQASEGRNALTIGNIAVPDIGIIGAYRLKTLESQKPLFFTTDSEGKAWLFVGTDSGHTGLTSLYYSSIGVTIEEDHIVSVAQDKVITIPNK